MNEANILKVLRHPNIPIIYDIEEDENYIYIIEEYIEGQSLRAYKLSQTKIEEGKLLDFLTQLCKVLDFLHSLEEPILYLDLKPDNILITKDNELKLVDFGTAQVFQKEKLVKYSYGTKGYAAPEQYGIYTVDKRSDIYGLGGILFFLASGTTYKGTKEELKNLERSFGYSKKFSKIIIKCLNYNPVNRYQSIKEVKKEATHLSQTKKELYQSKHTPHVISLAGTISRIGTTHISLMITSYLNQAGIPTLYIEQNEANVVEQFKNYMNGPELKRVPMAKGDLKVLEERYPNFKVFVCDCGVFTPQNKAYENGSTRFLVLGSKPWEWMLPQQNSKATYLINLTKNEDFAYIAKMLKDVKCIRVPFAPDYLSPWTTCYVKTFLQEILINVLEKKKQLF